MNNYKTNDDKTLVKIIAGFALASGVIIAPDYARKSTCENLFERKKIEYRFGPHTHPVLDDVRRRFFLNELYKDEAWKNEGCSIPHSFINPNNSEAWFSLQ